MDDIVIRNQDLDVTHGSISPSGEVSEPETNDIDFNNALSFVEEFLEVRDQLKEFKNVLPLDYKSEYNKVLEELDILIDIIDSENTPVELVKGKKLSGLLKRNKIERLGIAGEVVKLRRQDNCSMSEIAEMFNLSHKTVSRFFKYYDSLVPSQKSKYNRKSIFELTERLEELQTMILSQIYRLQGVKDDIAVKYVGELRQSLELAMKVAEKINDSKQMRREYEEFKQTIFDILKKELPHRQAEIIHEMKKFM